jgi:AcrR family transcriptional regulator
MSGKKLARPRSTYRHGSLKQALLEAGLDLARERGPTGVVLREATRRAGVAFNAAYRHYTGQPDLLNAVRAAALSQVARTMEIELSALGPSDPSAEYARSSLRAVGAGYLRFAREEAGLFRTAFVVPFMLDDEMQYSPAGESGLDPFQLLGMALDRMQSAGILPDGQRSQAEFLAWSAVHGMAMLMLDGPLRNHSVEQLGVLSHRLLIMVERGLQD